MRQVFGLLALVLSFALAGTASANSGFSVVGAWGASETCSSTAYTYEGSDQDLAKVVRYDGGKTQVTPMKAVVTGDIVEVTDDETRYTYRILGPNKLLFIGFTKISNGLEAKVKPYAWHRCG